MSPHFFSIYFVKTGPIISNTNEDAIIIVIIVFDSKNTLDASIARPIARPVCDNNVGPKYVLIFLLQCVKSAPIYAPKIFPTVLANINAIVIIKHEVIFEKSKLAPLITKNITRKGADISSIVNNILSVTLELNELTNDIPVIIHISNGEISYTSHINIIPNIITIIKQMAFKCVLNILTKYPRRTPSSIPITIAIKISLNGNRNNDKFNDGALKISAIAIAKPNNKRDITSSIAITLNMLFVTSPFALYSFTIIIIAAGAVDDAIAPITREKGNEQFKSNSVTDTKNNVRSELIIPMINGFVPNFLIYLNLNSAPIINDINDSANV